jgi:hypothetical protein
MWIIIICGVCIVLEIIGLVCEDTSGDYDDYDD